MRYFPILVHCVVKKIFADNKKSPTTKLTNETCENWLTIYNTNIYQLCILKVQCYQQQKVSIRVVYVFARYLCTRVHSAARPSARSTIGYFVYNSNFKAFALTSALFSHARRRFFPQNAYAKCIWLNEKTCKNNFKRNKFGKRVIFHESRTTSRVF